MNKNTSLIGLLAALLAALIPMGAHANPGDLYATDNTSIRIYAPDGTASIFASGLPRPRGLAFDGFGNLFVATVDTSTTFHDDKGQILKFAPDGTVTVFAAGAGLETPEGLAFDSVGNLWFTSVYFSQSDFEGSPLSNAGNGRVTEITPSGERSVLHLNPITSHENFGIAIDGQNNLFVADNFQSAIYKITRDRRVSTFVSIDYPVGLAFGGGCSGYACDGEGNITRIAPNGTQTLIVSGLGELRGLAFDFDGNLFAASPLFLPNGDGHNVIYKITPDGSVSVFATGLNVPQFLAVEP